MKNYDINLCQLSVMDMNILKDIMYSNKKGLVKLTSHDISKIYASQEKEAFNTLLRLQIKGLITEKSLDNDEVVFDMTDEQYFNALRILYNFNDVTTSICEMSIDDITRISLAYHQIEQHLQNHDIQGYDLSMDDVRVLRIIVQLAIEGFNTAMVDLREQLSSLGDVYYLTLILNRLSDYHLITYDDSKSSYYVSDEQYQKAINIVLDVHQMLNKHIL